MTRWTPRWLDAHGRVAPFRTAVAEALEAAEARVASAVEPPVLDVVVQAVPGGPVLPEDGLGGFTPSAEIVFLTLDPLNPNLRGTLGAPLERMIVHEVHHAPRWAGPGYGRTPGEALVAEGLAGRFVQEVFGSPPEPWEAALDPEAMAAQARDAAAGWDERHDHAAWFFGAGERRNWTGYGPGFELVGRYLGRHPRDRASALAMAPAHAFGSCLPSEGR